MCDKYRGWANVRSTTETRRRTHLVELDELLPLASRIQRAVLELPDLKPISERRVPWWEGNAEGGDERRVTRRH